MAFTSESGRFALRSRGGKTRAKNERARGFPSLVKARQVRALNRARQKSEHLAKMFDSLCSRHCPCVNRILRELEPSLLRN